MINRKLRAFVISAFLGFSLPVNADNNDILLKAFHKYGIDKCDNLIANHSTFNGNGLLDYVIEQYPGGIDGSATEVTVTRIIGSKGSTIKSVESYIQTPKKCYLNLESTVTQSGTCSSNMNGDVWYISSKLPTKDYTIYKSSSDIQIYAKDISVGNFKACIKETSWRTSTNHG